MDNVITIVNTRENPLDFDISIQGVDSSDAQVKFIIETNPVQFGFPCTKGEGEKWIVTIPPLPHIPQVAYNFHIEIVVDGYFFEALRGTVNVTAEPEVKTGTIEKQRPQVKITGGTGVKVEEPKEEPVEEKKEIDVDALAEKIIAKNKNKPKPAPTPVVEQPSPEQVKKDKLVHDAIEEFKNAPLKKKEVVEEGGAQKAYKMGLDDGFNSRPKKKAEDSFGPFADDYYKGYEDGKAAEDHDAWKEKTAAKRQGRDYHESAEPRKSNLAGAIEKLDNPELSEQAQKVRDIVKGK